MIWSAVLAEASADDLVVATEVLCARGFHRRREAAALKDALTAALGRGDTRDNADPSDSVQSRILRRARERLTTDRGAARSRENVRTRWQLSIDGDRQRFLRLGEEIAFLDAEPGDNARRLVGEFVAASPLLAPGWLWTVVTDPASLPLFLRILGLVIITLPDDGAGALEPLARPLALLAYDACLNDDSRSAAQLLFYSFACGGAAALTRALAHRLTLIAGPTCRRQTLYCFGIRSMSAWLDPERNAFGD